MKPPAPGYQLIEELPDRLAGLHLECHKGWDSGNTGTMKEASAYYNDALLQIITLLVVNYYPKDFITEQTIKKYFTQLFSISQFKQLVTIPSGESEGTITGLLVLNNVSGKLEETISDMVQAITGDNPKFNYDEWRTRWDYAKKAGNQ